MITYVDLNHAHLFAKGTRRGSPCGADYTDVPLKFERSNVFCKRCSLRAQVVARFALVLLSAACGSDDEDVTLADFQRCKLTEGACPSGCFDVFGYPHTPGEDCTPDAPRLLGCYPEGALELDTLECAKSPEGWLVGGPARISQLRSREGFLPCSQEELDEVLMSRTCGAAF